MKPDALKTVIINTATSDSDKRAATAKLRDIANGPASKDRDRATEILRQFEPPEPSATSESVTVQEFHSWLAGIDPARAKAMVEPFDPAWHFWRERGDPASFRLWRMSGIESTIEGFHGYIDGSERSPIGPEIFPLTYGEELSRESAIRAVAYLERRLANMRQGHE
jgi:hypothetical protein